MHDYLGTPTQAYDSRGKLVWEMLLDVYGNAKEYTGEKCFIPFRYQGQYEDNETELYYNRFRYYDTKQGNYISQDPIRLSGNNPTLYGFVENTNTLVDIFGLTECSILRQGDVPQKAKNIKKIITENEGINIAKLPSPPFSPKGTGRIFKNRPNSKGNRLPVVDDNMYPIKYVEYDVNYDPKIIGTANRGTERVVIDNNGKAYYTNDHYETFIEF